MENVYVIKHLSGYGYSNVTKIKIKRSIDGIGLRQAGKKRTLISRYELVKNLYNLDWVDTEPYTNLVINKFNTDSSNPVSHSYHIFFTKDDADFFLERHS